MTNSILGNHRYRKIPPSKGEKAEEAFRGFWQVRTDRSQGRSRLSPLRGNLFTASTLSRSYFLAAGTNRNSRQWFVPHLPSWLACPSRYPSQPLSRRRAMEHTRGNGRLTASLGGSRDRGGGATGRP